MSDGMPDIAKKTDRGAGAAAFVPEGLNDSQRRAVTHGEGPLLLLAGPGSGKTFTIANRLLYLLGSGVPPERILVITFTKEAALSMRRTFQNMGRGPGGILCPVNFGTFHSFFYHILLQAGQGRAGRLAGLSEKKNLMIPVLKKYSCYPDQERGEDLSEDAARLLSAVSYYKNTLRLEEAAQKAPYVWRARFGDILSAYEEGTRRAGVMDFDDMVYECRKLLSGDEALRREWQNRFSHILIDEFQDINPVQYETIRLLAGEGRNIFAVGDDDQAIYGFRGAEPDCLRRFEEEFGARRLLLDVNYRSGEEIVKASLAVIGENRSRFPKKLRSARGPLGREVACRAFEDRRGQYGWLTDVLRQALGEGESCAVLFRTNARMQGFAADLSRAGLPFEIRERAESIYEHFIVKDVTAYLALSRGVGKRRELLRIVNRPARYVSREAVAECGADFAALREYYMTRDMSARQRLCAVDALGLLERQLENIGRLSPALGVRYILRAAGYERYLRQRALGEGGDRGEELLWSWGELLEWLREDAARYDSFEAWEEGKRLYEMRLSGTAGGGEGTGLPGSGRQARPGANPEGDQEPCAGANPEGGQGPCPGADGRLRPVQLMTVHAAKGLEFDRVWIPDCNEKVFPHGRLLDGRTLEEERRIFYVAMTRAKKSLELMYLTGTEERPRQPSRFLNGIL